MIRCQALVLVLASPPLAPLPAAAPAVPRWGGYLRDFLPILTAVAVLTLILVVWLALVRARRRRRRYGSEGGVTLVRYRRPKLEDTGLLSLLKPRRRRRRKHRYHHRNPTLAETGGLPPIRQAASAAQGEVGGAVAGVPVTPMTHVPLAGSAGGQGGNTLPVSHPGSVGSPVAAPPSSPSLPSGGPPTAAAS
ncbi:MAG: hypothetical protein RMN51_09160 [Verrucomicrobiota bacterium]|nr:hypothetical protein [Limisphaera sp.]MDW8382259.1 hypothetical protein [Verrucomicrobiota bacterium]